MAALNPVPFITDSLDSIPDSLRQYYQETDEGNSFRLLVDGVVPKTKFDEFRDNNTDLNKKLAETERHLTVYRTLNEDPDKLRLEYDRLLKLDQRFKNKELMESEGFEKAIEQRTSEMKSATEAQVRALAEQLNKVIAERDTAIAENERIIIHRAITDAALAAGVLPPAVPDVLDRAARDGWTLDERKQPVMMRNGAPVYGDNAVDPMTPKEWATRTLRDSAPWYFNKAEGTGASGGNTSGGQINPWTATNWNLTKQGEYIQKEGWAKAEMMASAAGSSVNATQPPKIN